MTGSQTALVNGIPTKYDGINFRSRLEAKWAHFFDSLGWEWEYEPFDLSGYIPDFILLFPRAPLLVEVKPACSIVDLRRYTQKIEMSRWDNEALLVGASIFDNGTFNGDFTIGLLGEPISPDCYDWDAGKLFRCGWCLNHSLMHETGSYHCRHSGCYDGDGHIGIQEPDEVRFFWKEACNATQWMASGKI